MGYLYLTRSDGALVSFFGMSSQQITDMLAAQGMTCTFIDEATYIASLPK